MNHDQEKFIALIEEHKRIIYKICYMYTGNRDDFNDYTQETLLNLWKAFSNFREECKPQTWIYQITLNTCISFIRKEKAKPSTIVLQQDLNLFDETVDNSEIYTLYKMINTLNELDKAIILLYLEEKSYDEIAYVMKMTSNNIGVRLNRIKEKLRKMSNY